jgi:hypothetical protein
LGFFVRRPLTEMGNLFTEMRRPLTTVRRLFTEISRPLMEVLVEDFSSVGSGVASSVGCLVCKCLILSGQFRQCYLLQGNAIRITFRSLGDFKEHGFIVGE